MKKHSRHHVVWFIGLAALLVLLTVDNGVRAQVQEEFRTFTKEDVDRARGNTTVPPTVQQHVVPPAPLGCRGPVGSVIDVGYEGVKFTSALYGASPGGGDGGEFDRIPVLSTKVSLKQGDCLNAHLSAIVGGKPTYGVSRMAFFQVTLTPIGGVIPTDIVGHYDTPFGIPSPAVALEAEKDVDMYASNFFQKVGTGPHEVPPGLYTVDVWWAGGPWFEGPGGAIGAGFVLKLYTR